VGEAPERVRERQEEEHGVAAVFRIRAHVDRRGDQVLVREHAAFGRAGRPGRVDERSEIVFLDLPCSGLERVGVRARVRAAFGLELGQLRE